MASVRQAILRFIELNAAAQRVPEHLAYQQLLKDFGDQLIPGMIECLRDFDSDVRLMTIAILSDGMEPKNDELIPELIDRFSDQNQLVKCAAVLSMTEFGQSARPVLGQLKQFLEVDTEPFTRLCAACAISRIAPEDSSSVPVLLESLKCEVSLHRIMACDFLGERKSKTAVLNVLSLLSDPDFDVAFAAAEAVGKTFNYWLHAVAVIVAMIKNDDWTIRSAGKMYLSRLGRRAKADMDLLTMAINDDLSWEARLDFEDALDQLKQL